MPEAQTLTPAERKLCCGLLLLAGVGVGVLYYYRELVGDVVEGFITHWASRTLPALRAGRFPPFSFRTVLFAGLVTGALAALFLSGQYLAHLISWGWRLPLRTLWYWTLMFGLFTGALSLTILPVIIAPGFGALLGINAIVCLRYGGEAWLDRPEDDDDDD